MLVPTPENPLVNRSPAFCNLLTRVDDRHRLEGSILQDPKDSVACQTRSPRNDHSFQIDLPANKFSLHCVPV